MSTYSRTKRSSASSFIGDALQSIHTRIPLPRVSVYGLLMIGALIAFESFNYGTTEFALTDLLGDLNFAQVRWATILALAFCGMDIAGIVRLFTTERSEARSLETWYMLLAWLLAATMNAALTWWAVSLALIGHNGLGNEILGRETLIGSVPIFVAILVWLIRILVIGTFSMASGRLMTRPNGSSSNSRQGLRGYSAIAREPSSEPMPSFQPAPKPNPRNGTAHQRPVAARPMRSR
jgi:hypothetical protein